MVISRQFLAHRANYKQGRTKKIEYIVVHFTANNGDTARGNANYFSKNEVSSSAHFFVDENYVFESVPVEDTAWHCGGGLQSEEGHSFFGKCTNANSIGVELCSRKRGDAYYFEQAVMQNAAELIRLLMKKYGISAKNVIRHYDVTGKYCPRPFIDSGNWSEFKNLISEGEKMTLEEQKEFDSLKAKVAKLEAEKERIYHYVIELPDYARATIEKLLQKGIYQGASDADLNLPESMMRVFVTNDRAGLYN